MEAKTGIYIGVAFAGGLLLGGLAGYAITKKNSDIHTQQAIDEMKVEHKLELEKLKKEADVIEDTKTEEENYLNKKPPIMEMASIINRDSDSFGEHTKYASSINKEQIKNIIEESKEKTEDRNFKEQVVISYDTYVQLTNQGYLEKNFNYDVEEEAWRDWDSDSLYDPEELPFDAGEVVWGENDICYICDKDNHSIYTLEKV